MITIHPYIEKQNSFEPEALRVMSQAFQDACNALRVLAVDERGREIIATRVIDLAASGVIDAKALRDRVLLEARAAV